jgi:hypothetical protein
MEAAESGKMTRAWSSWCKCNCEDCARTSHEVAGAGHVAVSGPDTRHLSDRKGIRALNRFKIPLRWARLKRKQARVDWTSTTNLQSTLDVFPFVLQALEHIPQRTRVPCTFRIQADPAEQEICLLGICAMLYRSVRCARRMAPGCEQDDARQQSDRWCVEKLCPFDLLA